MKSWMNGLTPSVPRRAERQSVPNPSQAPPRITLAPMAFEAAPCGSVSNARGYGPYQSRHHAKTFPSMSYRPHGLGAFCPHGVRRIAAVDGVPGVIGQVCEGGVITITEARGGSGPGSVFPFRFRGQ